MPVREPLRLCWRACYATEGVTVDVAAGGVGVEAGLVGGVDELFSLLGVNAGDVDLHVGAYAEALDAVGEVPKLTAESMETSAVG